MSLTSTMTRVAAAAIAVVSFLPAQQASLSVFHGIPGLPAPVEVFANNSKLFSFAYGDSRGPLSLAPATYNIEVKLNGRTVLRANPTVAADRDYTAVAHLDASGGLKLSLFENDLSDPGIGRGRLVVRHLAAAPTVDIEAQTRFGSPSRIFRNVSNGQSGAVAVGANEYLASIFAAGTNQRAFGPAPLMIDAGKVHVVYAVGDLTGGSFRLLLQTINATVPAQLTVVHGIPDLPAPVEVFANNSKLFSFDFGDKVGPLLLPSGTYNIEAKLNGRTVLSGRPTVDTGKSYTAVAHLDANRAIKLSFFENDVAPTAPTEARVIARHLAAAPAVDIVAESGNQRTPLFQNVSNGQAGKLDVASGSYDISIFAAGTNNRVFGPVSLNLRRGTIYAVQAVGDINKPGKFTLVVQSFNRATRAPVINFEPSGRGCGGLRALSSTTTSLVNEEFQVLLVGARPQRSGLLHLGLSNTRAGSQSLPFDLSPLGATGCSLLQDSVATVPITTGNTGLVSVPITVGGDHVFDLNRVYLQFSVLDRQINRAGFALSNLLTVSR